MSATANTVLERTMRDEQFLDRFRQDPDAALDEYDDLTEQEMNALKSGDEDEIRNVIDDTLQAVVVVVPIPVPWK